MEPDEGNYKWGITTTQAYFPKDNTKEFDNDLKESGNGLLICTNESNLILTAKSKGNVIQNLHAVNGLGKILHHKNFVSNLTVRTEVDVWIFTAGRTHVIQLDFLKGSLTGGCLLGFGSVGTESGNKFLQLLDLLLFLFVGFLHLLDQQLAGLIPEVIVTCVQLDLAIVDICSLCTNLVLDTVIMGNLRLYEIMKEKEAIYAKEDFTDEDGIRASELEGEFAEMNGWEAESDAVPV